MTIFALPKQVAVTSVGLPYSLSKLYFYKAGTTTDQPVYTTAALNVAHAQPVVADAFGVFPTIYLDYNAPVDYRVQLKTVLGALIYDQDNYPKSGASGVTILSTQFRYEQTAAESAALVTPTDYPIPSHDAVSMVFPQRYDFDAAASGTNNYVSLVNAHSVANQSGSPVIVGGGTYTYKPTAELQSLVDLRGAGMSRTILNCDTTFTGRFLRCTGKVKFSDFEMQTVGLTKIGTALFVSDPTITSNTAYAQLSHMSVFGFAKALEIGNMSLTEFIHCRFENNTEGCWCVPDGSGANGFVTTIHFIDCAFVSNARNVHFLPPVNSVNVLFDGGTIETATGATAGSDFQNVLSLIMRNVNIEGNISIPSISCVSVGSVELDSLTLTNDAGPIVIADTNTLVHIKNVQTLSTHCVLTISGTTDKVVIENCVFPATGNTFPANTQLRNTTINGIYYHDESQEKASFTGARFNRYPRTGSTAVSGAGATDVYRFLDIAGTVINSYWGGSFIVRAIDNANSNNFCIYEVKAGSGNNLVGASNIQATTKLASGGTDPGVSVTPFTLANDGAGGAVKLQFTKNAAIAQVNIQVTFGGGLSI